MSNPAIAAEDGSYYATWALTEDREQIQVTMAATVAADGWVAIGFSANDRMPNSDMVVGYINGPSIMLYDSWASEYAAPSVDAQQDVTLLEGIRKQGKVAKHCK